MRLTGGSGYGKLMNYPPHLLESARKYMQYDKICCRVKRLGEILPKSLFQQSRVPSNSPQARSYVLTAKTRKKLEREEQIKKKCQQQRAVIGNLVNLAFQHKTELHEKICEVCDESESNWELQRCRRFNNIDDRSKPSSFPCIWCTEHFGQALSLDKHCIDMHNRHAYDTKCLLLLQNLYTITSSMKEEEDKWRNEGLKQVSDSKLLYSTRSRWLQIQYKDKVVQIYHWEDRSQVIHFISNLKQFQDDIPILLVSPFCSLSDWIKEIHRFAPSVPMILYHGNQKARDSIREKYTITYKKNKCIPLLLTSIQTCIRDEKKLKTFYWMCKIVEIDEGPTRPEQLSEQGCILELAIEAAASELMNIRDTLNEWDSKVGDGDCGSTMFRGASTIIEDMKKYYPLNDVKETIKEIGSSISRVMGGTSGIIYDILFKAAYAELKSTSQCIVTPREWASALQAAIAAVSKYGGASAGSRTLLDALIPASKVLEERLNAGDDPVTAFVLSSEAALSGAESTKHMHAQAGRSSYVSSDVLASVPDPGAMAAATWYRAAALAIQDLSSGSMA